MKLRKVFSISAILLVGLMSSCEKDMNNNSFDESSSLKRSEASSNNKKSHDDKGKDDKNNSGNNNDNSNDNKSNIASVNLGVAGDFAILSKTGITDVYKSDITGNIGASPITGAAILVSCDEVAGTIYSVDAAGPLPCSVTFPSMLTTAVGDMQTAYTDAAGRSNPDFVNLGAGNIAGLTLTPGLYNWSSDLVIPADITIKGNSKDIFIFQVAGNLDMSSAVRITLSNGAQAKNIFWVVAGTVNLGTTSHFEGNILGQTDINMKTDASINGRMLAQTAVTLQMNTVVIP